MKEKKQKEKVESKIKTIDIKGKPYVTVVERVKEFHRLNSKGTISTVCTENGSRVTALSTVTLDDGRQFTGHSQAEYGKGMMGAVALEVAETSAIGRALGFANIGLLDSVASAEEVRKNSGGSNVDKFFSTMPPREVKDEIL